MNTIITHIIGETNSTDRYNLGESKVDIANVVDVEKHYSVQDDEETVLTVTAGRSLDAIAFPSRASPDKDLSFFVDAFEADHAAS